MHRYAAYGLSLHSEVPIPDLPSGDGPPDILIREEPLEIPDLEEGPRGGDRITGHFYGRLLFEVTGGQRITIHRHASIDDELVAALVTGTLLTAALRQRGLLTLHASAVTRGDGVIAFAGESGWGKSTLGEAFLQEGYEVVTDDQLVLRFDDDAIAAYPGPAHLRIRPDVGAQLVEGFEALPPAAPGALQRRRRVPRTLHDPLPLMGVYVLSPEDAGRNAIEEAPPQEAALSLVTHSWARHMFTDPAYVARHLQACARIVREVPVRRLHRERTLAALGEQVALVEADVAKAGVRAA